MFTFIKNLKLIIMIVETVTNGNQKLDIIKDGNKYYFDYNGDWYDTSWCDNPLQKCINDAKEELNELA
jgi:hypothetical protein